MASASVSAAGLLDACLASVGRFWANSPTNGASKLWDAPSPPLSCPRPAVNGRSKSNQAGVHQKRVQTDPNDAPFNLDIDEAFRDDTVTHRPKDVLFSRDGGDSSSADSRGNRVQGRPCAAEAAD